MTRLARWVPTALVGLLPLVVVPDTFGSFHVGKWIFLCVVVPLGLAVLAGTGRLRWPERSWFLPWIGVSVVASVMGVAPWMSLAGSPNRNAGLIGLGLGVGAYVIGASVGDDPVAQRMVLRAAFVSGGVVGLLAVLEWLGVDLFAFGDLADAGRARSTWGSATFAGTHLALVLPIAVVHLRSRDPIWRWVAVVCTLSAGAGLLVTGTRGAWIATLVAAVVIAPRWISTRTSDGHTGHVPDASRARSLTVAGLVLVACAVAGAIMVPNLGRSSGVGRLDQIRTALPVVVDRPILGSGLDTQRVVLPSGIDVSFEVEHGSSALHDRVHNIVFDTAVTTGLLGVAAFGSLLFVLGRAITRGCRGQLVPTAIAGALAGYLTSLLFAFGDPSIDPIAWLLAGLVIAATDGREAANAGDAGDTGDAPVSVELPRSDSFVRTGAVVAMVVLSVAGGYWSMGELIADRGLHRALTRTSNGAFEGAEAPSIFEDLRVAGRFAPVRFDLDQVGARIVTKGIGTGTVAPEDPVVVLAFSGLDHAERVAGDDPDVLMDRAELLSAVGRGADAVTVYERVLRAYPHSFRAHLGLGVAQAESGNEPDALTSWELASQLGPRDARADTNLGLLQLRLGDVDSAAKHFREALRRDPNDKAAAQGLAHVTAD